MPTDYIDENNLYHFCINDHDQIVTPDKEYIEQVLARKFGADFDGKVVGIYGIKEKKEDRADSLSYVRYSESDALVTRELLRKQFMEEKEMNYNSKVITLIGSMSEVNKAAMIALYNRLTYKGHNVKLPYMGEVPEDVSDDQIEVLRDLHKTKMDSANLIIVVDADGHIGKDTQREIDWCNERGRNIIYLSDMQVYDGEEKQTKGGKRS